MRFGKTVNRGCWAAPIGGCSGKLSREHLISECLLTDSVGVEGWWHEKAGRFDIGKGALTAKCLCKHHNRLLSPVDYEAKRLRRILLRWRRDEYGSSSQADASEWRLNGHRIGKWLAKTACTNAYITRHHVPLPLIEYAFSTYDRHDIRVYFAGMVGAILERGADKLLINWLRPPDHQDAVVIHIDLFGLPFLLSTFSLAGQERIVLEKFGIPFEDETCLIDRLAALRISTNESVDAVIAFDWQSNKPNRAEPVMKV